MKNLNSPSNKSKFLIIDFYVQCFFVGLLLLLALSSIGSGYFVILGLFSLIPIAFYNSISLTYHIFQGSYSKKVELFRKMHAISAIIYLLIFVLVFFVFDYAANANELTFLIFWGIPPLFLLSYFFITWQDWKEMKKLNK